VVVVVMTVGVRNLNFCVEKHPNDHFSGLAAPHPCPPPPFTHVHPPHHTTPCFPTFPGVPRCDTCMPFFPEPSPPTGRPSQVLHVPKHERSTDSTQVVLGISSPAFDLLGERMQAQSPVFPVCSSPPPSVLPCALLCTPWWIGGGAWGALCVRVLPLPLPPRPHMPLLFQFLVGTWPVLSTAIIPPSQALRAK
jgi:hypothetical protein